MRTLPGLQIAALGREFLWLPEVDSTNTYLKNRMDTLPDGFAVCAGYQSAGKGTRSRRWEVESGSSLMFSVLLRDIPSRAALFVPLLVGLAVCESVAGLGCAAAIKWPNDVVAGAGNAAGGKKICGILCESRADGDSCSIVAGIGVNLLQSEEEFIRLNLLYATSLQIVTGKKIEPLTLAALILNHLEPLLDECRAAGFSESLRSRYKSRSATVGRQIRLLRDGSEATAFARDINEDGSLLIERGGVQESVYAGDVSVRGLYGYVD